MYLYYNSKKELRTAPIFYCRGGPMCPPDKPVFPIKPVHKSENNYFLSTGAHTGAPLRNKGKYIS